MGGCSLGRKQRRTQARQLENLSARLSERMEALQPLASRLEAKFTAISDALVSLPSVSRRLVNSSESFLESASGRQVKDTLFPPILALLDPPLTFLRRCVPQVCALGASLREVSSQIGEVLASEEATYMKMAQLRYIRPMIRIEASRFDAVTEASVLSLGAQIESFTAQLGEALCCKFGVMHDALYVIRKVGSGLEENAKTLGLTVTAHDSRIQSLITSFREGLEINAHRDIRLTSVAVEVSALVGRMVVSLQAQDILSQRLAHVSEGLERLRGSLKARQAIAALKLARIAAAQLNSIGEEFQKTEDNLRDASTRARSLLLGIERTCLDLPEFTVKTIGDEGLVVLLTSMVDAFEVAVRGTAAQVRDWASEIQPLGSYAADATALMRGISAGIRIIALNSQITSSNISGGRALDVLATHVGSIAMEATESAQNSAGQSDEVVRRLAGIVQTFGDFQRAGAAVTAGLAAERDECLSPLRKLAEEALAGRATVVAAIGDASALLAAMEGHLDLSSLRDSAIAPAEDLLGEIISVLETLPMQEAGTHDAETEHLATAYTMESEKRIHIAALGESPGTSPTPPAKIEDFESFAVPESGGSPDPANASAPRRNEPAAAAAGGDIEFF